MTIEKTSYTFVRFPVADPPAIEAYRVRIWYHFGDDPECREWARVITIAESDPYESIESIAVERWAPTHAECVIAMVDARPLADGDRVTRHVR